MFTVLVRSSLVCILLCPPCALAIHRYYRSPRAGDCYRGTRARVERAARVHTAGLAMTWSSSIPKYQYGAHENLRLATITGRYRRCSTVMSAVDHRHRSTPAIDRELQASHIRAEGPAGLGRRRRDDQDRRLRPREEGNDDDRNAECGNGIRGVADDAGNRVRRTSRARVGRGDEGLGACDQPRTGVARRVDNSRLAQGHEWRGMTWRLTWRSRPRR